MMPTVLWTSWDVDVVAPAGGRRSRRSC